MANVGVFSMKFRCVDAADLSDPAYDAGREEGLEEGTLRCAILNPESDCSDFTRFTDGARPSNIELASARSTADTCKCWACRLLADVSGDSAGGIMSNLPIFGRYEIARPRCRAWRGGHARALRLCERFS